MKKTIVLLITSIIFAIVFVTTVVFAWFSIVEKTRSIIIYSGKLELSTKLYEVNANGEKEINEIKFIDVVAGDKYKYKLVLNSLETSIDGNLNIRFDMTYSSSLKNLIIINFSNGKSTTPESSYKVVENHLLNQYNKEYIIEFEILFSNNITIEDMNEMFKINQIEVNFNQALGGNDNETN